MDRSQCTDWTQVRDRIRLASASLSVSERTFDDLDLRSTYLAGCWLSALTPAFVRGDDQSNAAVAQFLHILPDSYMSSDCISHAARPRLIAALAMIMPAEVSPASTAFLKAVRAAKFVALTNSEPPLDSFVEYDDIVAELNRRLQPTNEARFSPILNRHFTRSDIRLTRFWGSAGNCALVDSAFLDTLTGDGVLNVETTHWLHHVMPNSLATVTIGGSTLYLVPLRLLSYLFIPAVTFTAAADAVSVPFFLKPTSTSRFLSKLLKLALTVPRAQAGWKCAIAFTLQRRPCHQQM